jgi:hypothetical protein
VSGGFAHRLPRIALVAFVVGLTLHNLAMSGLTGWGVEDSALDVVSAWKDALLVLALAAGLWATRHVPLSHWADRLALVYAAVVLVYWLLPQSWLDGDATARGELFAVRHHLLPVGAYFLGRLLALSPREWRLAGLILAATAAGIALWGLADVYLVGLQWWRDSGVPDWFREQLGLEYEGLSGLPENWVLNTGDEQNPIRRLVSTLLSPLAASYALVVVVLFLAARRPLRGWWLAAAVLSYAGLLWTHTRAALLALAGGLVVLALVQRRRLPVVLAAASLLLSVGFVKAFPHIGPSTSYTQEELELLRDKAAEYPGEDTDPFSAGESSLASHWRSLRDGVETVVEHPQGFGVGNAGVSASRTGADVKAGESTYTELGVDTGIAGAAAFIAWLVALLVALSQRSAWLTAAVAAVAALGLQTDVIGVHWIAYVVFALAGAALTRPDPSGAATGANGSMPGA